MNKNGMIAVAADKGGTTWFRKFFLSPGAQEAKICIQCRQGWVTLDPDPNRGFILTHTKRPLNQSGRWLRGEMHPSCGVNDVKIARALLGHRFWMVSHWRVWVYRIIAFFASVYALNYVGLSDPVILSVIAVVILLIPSPCTPRGLLQWCERMGWAESKLAASSSDEGGSIDDIRQQIQEAKFNE